MEENLVLRYNISSFLYSKVYPNGRRCSCETFSFLSLLLRCHVHVEHASRSSEE